ncbi:MAG: SDR family NAD(P)-dependent oxidoreductase [Clostridia bacterium]|nr:SDR family NAD(P)-dependent oxidoreductase [Clostridia bacterium]
MEKKYKSTAIVVGGSSGIGCETCLRLANRNWNVINISRTPCKNAKVKNIVADVTSGSTFTDAITATGKKYGLDVLIYCAGFSMAAPIEYAKESDYRYLFDVNFFGALKAMQAAIPFMKDKGGRIILVGSLGGDIPILFDAFYSASKAALEMLVREAYSELKPYNIKVTAYLPGGTATGFTFKRKVYTDEENKSYAQDVNKAVNALEKMEQSGMSPALVAEGIYELLLTDKPPVVKASGFKNSAYRIMAHVMPEKMTLYFNNRAFRQ